MNASLRDFVRSRAKDRCEYYRLPQSVLPLAPFHIEHIQAVQHGGCDEAFNLALACDHCNAFKGPNLTAVDPHTNKVIMLFNPRTPLWKDHFERSAFEIRGVTDVGRATCRLLQMNARRRVQLRTQLQLQLDSQ